MYLFPRLPETEAKRRQKQVHSLLVGTRKATVQIDTELLLKGAIEEVVVLSETSVVIIAPN
jgi:hypothetical protein